MSETDNFPEWKSLFGKTLDGGYELKDIVEAEQDRAVLRVRVLGDYSLKASASFYVLPAGIAEEQSSLWQAIRNVEKKSNLHLPLGAGTLLLDRTGVAYVVSQNADETLKDVLKNRALSPEEATEVLRSVARGLGELHANGFVHGSLSPEEVLAVEDRIDLSIEGIRRVNSEPLLEMKNARYLAPESGTRNLTIASDVWCLGATLFETLTQKTYEPEMREQAEKLRHPLGTAASRCLDSDPEKRCNLGELEQILRSKAPPPPKPKPVTPVAPEARIEAVESGKTKSPNGPVASPKLPNEAPVPVKLPNKLAAVPKLPNELPPSAKLPSEQEAEDRVGLSSRRGWIYALAAFLAIFFALWAVRARNSKRAASIPAKKDAQTASTSQPGAAWPTKTLEPDVKAPVPSMRTPVPPAAALPTKSLEKPSKTIWRVVLYTYHRQQDAENKAKEIGGKRPDLEAEVFSPAGGPYLVVAGGKMDREEASRVRARAIREGMPHDSYIQNYSK